MAERKERSPWESKIGEDTVKLESEGLVSLQERRWGQQTLPHGPGPACSLFCVAQRTENGFYILKWFLKIRIIIFYDVKILWTLNFNAEIPVCLWPLNYACCPGIIINSISFYSQSGQFMIINDKVTLKKMSVSVNKMVNTTTHSVMCCLAACMPQ